MLPAFLSCVLVTSGCKANLQEFFGSKTPDPVVSTNRQNSYDELIAKLIGEWSYLFVEPNLNSSIRSASVNNHNQRNLSQSLSPTEGKFTFSQGALVSLNMMNLAPVPAGGESPDAGASGTYAATDAGDILIRWLLPRASQLLLFSPQIQNAALEFGLPVNGQIVTHSYFQALNHIPPWGGNFRGGVWYLAGQWGFETLVIGPSGYAVAFLGDGVEEPQIVDGYLQTNIVDGANVVRFNIFQGQPANVALQWDFSQFELLPAADGQELSGLTLRLRVGQGTSARDFEQVLFGLP